MVFAPIATGIARFLGACQVRLQGETGGLVLFVKDGDDGEFEKVKDYVLKPNQSAETMGHDIATDAEMRVSGEGNGTYRFRILAFRDKDQFDRYAFSLEIAGQPESTRRTDRVHERSLLTQAYRALEMRDKTLQGMVNAIGSIIASQGQRIEQQNETQAQMFQTMKELAIAHAQMSVGVEQKRSDIKIKEKLVEETFAEIKPLLAPAAVKLMAAIAGKDGEDEEEEKKEGSTVPDTVTPIRRIT
jgi:hypothetical protein